MRDKRKLVVALMFNESVYKSGFSINQIRRRMRTGELELGRGRRNERRRRRVTRANGPRHARTPVRNALLVTLSRRLSSYHAPEDPLVLPPAHYATQQRPSSSAQASNRRLLKRCSLSLFYEASDLIINGPRRY